MYYSIVPYSGVHSFLILYKLLSGTFLADFAITLRIWTNLYRTLLKRFAIFPSPAGMSLTKLTLAGNN
jgi:hypothetical protein